MTDIAADTEAQPKKGSKLPIVLGLVLALLGGAGGFLAVQRGLLPFGESADHATTDKAAPLPEIAFVEVDPIVVSLPDSRVVRFRAQLEVTDPYMAEVQKMLPRVVDVMNGYLRALEPADFEDPAVLPRMRGQLLRRIQVVVGEGRVRDILIMEFVLS